MGPLPKQKLSKARRDRRRSHLGLKAIDLVRCPQCGELRKPHRVCSACGTYQGEQVVEVEEKS